MRRPWIGVRGKFAVALVIAAALPLLLTAFVGLALGAFVWRRRVDVR